MFSIDSRLGCRYDLFTAMLQCLLGVFMADVKLNDAERKVVVDALATREASVLRAAKAATNQVIAEELRKEYSSIVVLRQRLSTS